MHIYIHTQTPFWNQFFVAALRDSDGAVVNYVGVQVSLDLEEAISLGVWSMLGH